MRSCTELLQAVRAVEYSLEHAEEWRNDLAKDMNVILGRLEYILETGGDELDCQYAEASLRLVFRVGDFEEIRRKGGAR